MNAKRILCLLLCLLLAASAGGCTLHDLTPRFSGDASLLPIGSPYKHYFELLSETEKTAYNAVLTEITAFPERIEVPVLTRDELNSMYEALLYDNPELFFVSGKTVVRQVKKRAYLYPEYRMAAPDFEAMSRKCGEIAEQIAQQAREKTAPFDRERVVHDQLISTCTYTNDETNVYKGTIYGALCGGECACEGYAKTTKYLLDMLDIPCFVVHGNSTPPGSRTESHMWNVVQLDGEWYHLDLTWDDPVLDKGGEIVSYSYFNVTDEMLRRTHTDFDAHVACTATKYNFFAHEKLLFKQFGDEEKKRTVTFASQLLNAGSDGFQLRFADKKAFDSAQKTLFDKEQIYALLKRIEPNTQRKISTKRVTYYATEDDFTINIILVS